MYPRSVTQAVTILLNRGLKYKTTEQMELSNSWNRKTIQQVAGKMEDNFR